MWYILSFLCVQSYFRYL